MDSMIPEPSLITPDKSVPIGSLRMASADNDATSGLSPLTKEAARRAHGKQEAAARHLGKQPSNFSRDVDRGDLRLRDLEALGPSFLAEFGRGLIEQYGALTDPKTRARLLIRDMEQCLAELRQYVEAA